MATVVLARHGVTSATGKRAGGRTAASLTEPGRAQARAVAARLSGETLRAVYTSPVARAVETAHLIAEPHGLEVEQVDGVAEIDHGRWTDRPLAQMRRTKHFTYVVRTPSRVALPEGESFVAAQGRAVAAVEEIVAAHAERETVVVTTHADVIKLLVAHYVGMPIDAFQRLVVSPASLTRLVLPKRGDARLMSFNDVAHL